MMRSALLSAALLFGAGANAAYSEYFFASEASDWHCPDMSFECIPPQVCVFDNVLNKHTCCDSGGPDKVCWGHASKCDQNTINCGDEENRFCCISNKEECTKSPGQINICWGTAPDPVAAISEQEMNRTFSSLLAESPSASQLSFDLDSLLSTPTPTPTPSVASGTSSIPNRTSFPLASGTEVSDTPLPTLIPGASPPPPNTPNDRNQDDGPSAGIIAGGVIAGVFGVALIAGGIFLLGRRRSAAKGGSELDGNPYVGRTDLADGLGGYGKGEGHYPPQMYPHEAAGRQAPVEMSAVHDAPVEMEGSKPQNGW